MQMTGHKQPGSRISEEHSRAYANLCQVLAGRTGEVDWEELSPGDWARFGELADTEGVAPIVYWILKESWPEKAPEELRNRLRLAYIENYRRNRRMLSNLEDALQALEAAGVPVIVLKGAGLARTVYPDEGLRSMSDLDVLVPQELCDKAGSALAELGYAEVPPETSGVLRRKLEHHHVWSKDEAAVIEIHWRLAGGPGFAYGREASWFWGQSVQAGSMHTLDANANLLYLAAHTMLQHGGSRATLRNLYDVKLLVEGKGGPVDWTALDKQARRLSWTAGLRAMLSLTEQRLGVKAPPGFVEGLKSDGPLEDLVRSKQMSFDTLTAGELKVLASLHRGTQLIMLLFLLLPSPAYIRKLYKPRPVWSWPIYYFIRWFDIGVDLIRTITKSLKKLFYPL